MPNIDQVQLPDGSQYNLRDNISGYVTAQYVNDVIDGLTKANVGLGNVDNTSDLNKPVSTAQQTALNGKTNTTVIATTEATTTASRRYEIGEQFILNGVLYTATAVIASGDTIIVNTNCVLSESITKQLKDIDLSADNVSFDNTGTDLVSENVEDAVKEVNANSAKSADLTSISESGTTASQAISAGTYFYLNGTLVRAKTAIASGATFTLNTNYEVPADGALNDVKDIISYFTNSSGSISRAVCYGGHVVEVNGSFPKAGGTIATVASPYIPSNMVIGGGTNITGGDGSKWVRVTLDTSGNLSATVSSAFTYNSPFSIMYIV